MSVPNWPAALRQSPRRGSWTGGPQDSRASFEPEYGEPLQRRRTTADPEVFEGVVFQNLSGADVAVLKAFYQSDLHGGALAFSWRDPVSGEAARWKVIGSGKLAYSLAAKGADLHDLSINLMRLPGAPWWGPYLRVGSSVVPQVVADWDAGVYGIGGGKVAASALPAVTGTFDVWSTSTVDVETFTAGVVIGAGAIPATAPALVKRRVYFAT